MVMDLNKFAGIIRSLFNRLLGGNGARVSEATTLAGRFHTLYVASETTFTAVVGGGADAQTWLTTIPAGSTLTTPLGLPITSFTTSVGLVIAY